MTLGRIELADVYPDEAFRRKFVDLFSLSRLARASLKRDGIADLASAADALVLSELGEVLCREASERFDELAHEEIKVGAFLAFYWRDLLIDVDNTDFVALARQFGEAVAERRIYLPWLYGREIDDRYLDQVGELREQLDEHATRALVADLPQGVFQAGRLLTGPWGLLEADEGRWLVPGLIGPMLGCSDPGCNGTHPVRLTAEDSPIREVEHFMDQRSAEATDEEPSAWPAFARDLVMDKGGDFHHDDLNPADLPLVVANALSEEELQSVLSTVMETNPASIRSRIPEEGPLSDLFRNSPDTIVSGISAAEAIQLLLVASDGTLIEGLEEAIDAHRLEIPPTESRNAVVARFGVYTGMYQVSCEIGPAGVRVVPRQWVPSVAMRLRRLIEQLYPGDDGQSQLEWKLRSVSGQTVSDKLDAYLTESEPATVVYELVFESRSRLESAFRNLRWGRFGMPTTPEEERALVDRILWKLGSDVFYYPPGRATFLTRLEALRKVARDLPEPYEEPAREAIRGPGTNLFVSFEELLDLSVCFVGWALLSDHWAEGRRRRFVYTPGKARRYTAALLNGQPISASEELSFDASGKNTLFGLAKGFEVLARLLAGLLSGDATQYLRDPQGLPHFLQNVGLEQFPFRHVHPVFDLRTEAATSIVSAVERVCPLLDRAKALDVRNRIPHNREPFPSRPEVEGACNALEEVVDLLSQIGAVPAPYLYEVETTDRFRRTRTTLVDDLGRSFELLEPSPLRMNEMPETETPQLIFLGARLPGASDVLRFSYAQDSDYLTRWGGFPAAASTPSHEHTAPEN